MGNYQFITRWFGFRSDSWKTFTSWVVLGAIVPSLAFSAGTTPMIPSLADPSALKKVVEYYNSHLEIKPSFYSFAKANLSKEDNDFLVAYLKKNKTIRFPKAEIAGKSLRFEGGGVVELSRNSDGKLVIKVDGDSIATASERTLLSDVVKSLRKKNEKGVLSAFADFLVPDAHAFVAPLILIGLGALAYSYRHELRNAWEDLTTSQADYSKVKYIQDAREHLYSCEKEKENWEDNWYEQNWFFGGVSKDNRPDLNTQEGKMKFANSVTNTENDLIRATRKHLLDCKNTANSAVPGHEERVKADQADYMAVRPSNQKVIDQMDTQTKDQLCKVWDEWDTCLNEVKTLKRQYAAKNGVLFSQVSQSQDKPVDRSPAIIEKYSEGDAGSATTSAEGGPRARWSSGASFGNPF